MIHKLSDQIINRIAAGQVVQRPYNALKQLLQNSIDAGATIIHIQIQSGGLNKIQIKDNGKGIIVQDYPLLCSRYATSKIKNLTDLQSIQSFGFRGQALASLTHVGKVQVLSRHQKCSHGYFAKFDRQKLIGEPKIVRRQIGTTIKVEDLFTNLSSRRKSLTPNQEKKLIKQLIYQVALDYPYIQFTLTTQKGQQMYIDYSSYEQNDAIFKIFCQLTGMLKQNCLLTNNTINQTKVLGVFSKLNTWQKWRNLIVTINHRIVQCPQIEKVIQKAYDNANRTIHKQNYSYCCYINIRINPQRIDCNVHPTKKMIHFYKGGNLFYEILNWIQNLLQNSGTVKYIDNNNSRLNQNHMMTLQSKLKEKKIIFSQKEIQKVQRSQNVYSQKTEYDCNKTRTDCNQLPLPYFYKFVQASSLKQKESQQQKDKNSTFNQKFTYRGLDQDYSYRKYQIQTSRNYSNKNQKQNIIVKSFIHSITYVGCFNSSFIFIQLQNKLLCLQIYHFIVSYIKLFIKQKNSFPIKRLKQSQQISISQLLQRFFKRNSDPNQDPNRIKRIYDKTISQIIYNKQIAQQKFGIKINQISYIVSYPIIDKVFENQTLRQDSLAFFLIQLFGVTQLDCKEKVEKVYLQFLASPFLKIQKQMFKMSPFTDYYDNFFKNQLIPTLKLKGKFNQQDFRHIQISNLLSEMMDLKDAYKMFQRC